MAEGAEAEAAAKAVAVALAEAAPPPFPPAEDMCRLLNEAEMGVVVGMLPASLGGAILGSALLWQQAAASDTCGSSSNAAAAALGTLGAVEALVDELHEGVEARQLLGHAMAQAPQQV